MVVLAASVLSRSGKTLVSRQYVPMTRIKIEGLLAAFPKLIDNNSQSTFVETGSVRYVYQPLEQLYVVLVTTKQSNIMEDLETLRTVAKLIPEYCGGSMEANVTETVFELIFAMDEVLSLGHKEHVSLQQIRTFVEMDSHEEKLQKIIMESKIREAEAEGIRMADVMKRKNEQRRLDSMNSGGYGGPEGGQFGDTGRPDYSARTPQQPPQHHVPVTKKTTAVDTKPRKKKPGKGWSLKKKAAQDDFIKEFAKEEKLSASDFQAAQRVPDPQAAAEPVAIVYAHPHIAITEAMTILLDQEGEVKKIDLKGELKVFVSDPDESRIVIQTTADVKNNEHGFKFRPNPKVNNKAFSAGGLVMKKDLKQAFSVGNDNATVAVKWILRSKDEDLVPLTVSFWASPEDGVSVVSMEYTLNREDMKLDNVIVSIPLGDSTEAPEIRACEEPMSYQYDRNTNMLHWFINTVTSDNDTGSLEFAVPQQEEDSAFYPIQVQLQSADTFSGITVKNVVLAEKTAEGEPQPVEFTQEVKLTTPKYLIEMEE